MQVVCASAVVDDPVCRPSENFRSEIQVHEYIRSEILDLKVKRTNAFVSVIFLLTQLRLWNDLLHVRIMFSIACLEGSSLYFPVRKLGPRSIHLPMILCRSNS